MAEYEVRDSSGNYVGTFIEAGSDYSGEPSKPRRVHKRKVINKLINRISFFAFFALIVAYFVGIFDLKDLTFTFGMLGYILPLMILDVSIFLFTLRFLRATDKIENYIINETIDKQENDNSENSNTNEDGVSLKFVDEVVEEVEETDIISLENTIKVSHLKNVVAKNASDKRCERLNNSIKDAINFKTIEKNEPVVFLDSIIDYYLGKYNSKTWVFKLSYLLFVFFAVFVVLENVLEVENVVFASLVFPFYTISFMLFGLSCYRTYNFYVGTLETSQGRAFAEIAKVFFAVMSLVIILSVVLTQFGLKISYSMFIAGFAFCDLAMILISKSLIKKVRNGVKLKELFTGRFPITKLIVVEIILFVVFLGIICGLSLGIESIYKALEAYDNGISTDLSVPIRFWVISGGISVIIMIVVGFLIVKKSKKKSINIK